MTRKQRIATIVFASILLLSVITVTYAFFTASPNSQSSSYVTLNSGTLQLRIDDSTGYQGKVELTRVDPFHLTLDRYFEITNTGTVDAYAKIYWHDLVNSYLPGSLKYTLYESKNNGSTYTEVITNRNVPRNASTPKDTKLSNDLLIPQNNTTYKYKLTIRYDYKDNYDQTRDINASFISGFTIVNGKEITADTVNPSDIPANHLRSQPYTINSSGNPARTSNNILGKTTYSDNSTIAEADFASINIVTTNVVPASAIESWDVTASGGTAGSVKAWYTTCEITPTGWTQTNCYDLYIGQEGGVIAPNDMSRMFSGYSNAKTMDLQYLDTSYVTSMFGEFCVNEKLLNLNISTWNTSNVTTMNRFFSGCSSLTTLNISNFNTTKVTDMCAMFHTCTSLTSIDVRGFDTSNVIIMSGMFCSCTSLTILDLGNFDTSKVTAMDFMICGSSTIHINVESIIGLENFDTSNVTNMSTMFQRCMKITTLDISNFDTSKVTDMSYLFTHCEKLTSLDLSTWNTSNVTNVKNFFSSCDSLKTINISGFNLSKVTTSANAQGVFNYCSALTELTTPAVMSPQTIALPKTLYASNGTSYASLTSSTPVKTVLKTSWT